MPLDFRRRAVQRDRGHPGRCRMVAFAGLSLEILVAPGEVHSRRTAITGPAPGLTSAITPAATAALMMWWRQ